MKVHKSFCVPASLKACGISTKHLEQCKYGWWEISAIIKQSGMFKRGMGHFTQLFGKSVKRALCELPNKGKFIILTNRHAIAKVDGIIYDTWGKGLMQ